MKHLRELREEKGFTQLQFAQKLGLKSASTVSMWETGDRLPRTEKLKEIADLLECTIDELLSDN